MSKTTPNTDKDDATDQPTNQPSRDDLSRFQHDLLAVIAGYQSGRYRDDRHTGDRPHGLAIRDTLAARYNTEVHHGRLYPNLDTLVEHGLVEKIEADRRTNYYQLTSEGWEFLQRRAQFLTGCLDGNKGDA